MVVVKEKRVTIDNVAVGTIDGGLQWLGFDRIATRRGLEMGGLSGHKAVSMVLPVSGA